MKNFITVTVLLFLLNACNNKNNNDSVQTNDVDEPSPKPTAKTTMFIPVGMTTSIPEDTVVMGDRERFSATLNFKDSSGAFYELRIFTATSPDEDIELDDNGRQIVKSRNTAQDMHFNRIRKAYDEITSTPLKNLRITIVSIDNHPGYITKVTQMPDTTYATIKNATIIREEKVLWDLINYVD